MYDLLGYTNNHDDTVSNCAGIITESDIFSTLQSNNCDQVVYIQKRFTRKVSFMRDTSDLYKSVSEYCIKIS